MQSDHLSLRVSPSQTKTNSYFTSLERHVCKMTSFVLTRSSFSSQPRRRKKAKRGVMSDNVQLISHVSRQRERDRRGEGANVVSILQVIFVWSRV